jgi:UDP:flavonoid glycosyltransferase YjiC (YdhE family)
MVHVLGEYGHFLPMVPIARALEAGGHEVVFATEQAACTVLAELGLHAIPIDAGVAPRDWDDWSGRTLAR